VVTIEVLFSAIGDEPGSRFLNFAPSCGSVVNFAGVDVVTLDQHL
jgi:hypothetical protein